MRRNAVRTSFVVIASAGLTAGPWVMPPEREIPAPRPESAPTADFTWSMAERAGRSARFYEEARHAYSRSYVHPDGWSVYFNACALEGTSGSGIVSYDWAISRLAPSGRRLETHRVETPHCFLSATSEASGVPPQPDGDEFDLYPHEIIPKLPALGRYHVTLVVEDQRGRQDTTRKTITLKDHLIVIVGDSYAAGQGNPDRPGEPEEIAGQSAFCETTKLAATYLDLQGDGGRVRMAREPVWMEPLAWRSYRSGPVLAALDVEERDPHSAVTLVHYASSGATIPDVINEPQREFQEDKLSGCEDAGEREGGIADHRRACGQLREVAETSDGRTIDALVVSVGGNDAGFARVLKKALDDPLENSAILRLSREAIERLPRQYRQLDREVRDQLDGDVGQIFITGYPADVFSDSDGRGTTAGCGMFAVGLSGRLAYLDGVGRKDARLLRELGEELDRTIAASAEELDWTFVRVSDGFLGHGYCTGRASYLRFAEHSCEMQGDVDGTMHPDGDGHRVYRERLREALSEYFDARAAEPMADAQVEGLVAIGERAHLGNDETPTEFEGQIQGSVDSSACFHKKLRGWDNGNPIHLWDCRAGSNAMKTWRYDEATGYIRSAVNPDKCMHKKWRGWDNGNPIHLWDCDAGSNAMKTWRYEEATGYIRSAANPNKCMHKKRPDWNNGNPIHLWDCDAGSDAMKSWNLGRR